MFYRWFGTQTSAQNPKLLGRGVASVLGTPNETPRTLDGFGSAEPGHHGDGMGLMNVLTCCQQKGELAQRRARVLKPDELPLLGRLGAEL
jgi:hypothetical protein